MAELSGQGPVVHSGATSVVDAQSAPGGKLGSRGVDVDGNEYVYVDFQESCIPGEWVAFSAADYKASQLAATSLGFVGIVMTTVSASDRFGWVMVRGTHTGALISSGTSVGPVVAHTTAVGALTNAGATGGIAVYGVALHGAPDTCASTAIGATDAGISTVSICYPFITGAIAQATS